MKFRDIYALTRKLTHYEFDILRAKSKEERDAIRMSIEELLEVRMDHELVYIVNDLINRVNKLEQPWHRRLICWTTRLFQTKNT